MKEIVSSPDLVAYCGLYCGACKRYRMEKCPGCRENEKAAWCKVRACCRGNHYSSCAESVLQAVAEEAGVESPLVLPEGATRLLQSKKGK